MPRIDAELLARLTAPGPGRHVAEAPIVGHWPTALADPLLRHLSDGGERAVRRWAATTGIEAITAGAPLVNVNTPADLAALAKDQLSGPQAREKVRSDEHTSVALRARSARPAPGTFSRERWRWEERRV